MSNMRTVTVRKSRGSSWNRGEPIFMSVLHRLEIENALNRKVFTKELRPRQVRGVLELFASDFATGVLVQLSLDLEGRKVFQGLFPKSRAGRRRFPG